MGLTAVFRSAFRRKFQARFMRLFWFAFYYFLFVFLAVLGAVWWVVSGVDQSRLGAQFRLVIRGSGGRVFRRGFGLFVGRFQAVLLRNSEAKSGGFGGCSGGVLQSTSGAVFRRLSGAVSSLFQASFRCVLGQAWGRFGCSITLLTQARLGAGFQASFQACFEAVWVAFGAASFWLF